MITVYIDLEKIIKVVTFVDYPKYGWKNPVKYAILFTISFTLISANPTVHLVPELSELSDGRRSSRELRTFEYTSVDTNGSDFIVVEDLEVVIKDRVFRPEGDIIVERGGRLILQNAEIIFNHSRFYEHGILLKEDTAFEAYDSHIRGLDNLFFFRAYGANLMIQNTTFRRTHMVCGNNTQIQMVHSYLWALHCLNDTTVDVVDSHLCYLLLMGNSTAKVDDTRMIEIILSDSSRVSVSDTTLRFIFYFDEGKATISNCSYEDEIRFKPRLCDLIIEVLDEDTLDPLPKASVCLNRPEGNEVTSSLTDSDGTASFTDLEEGDYFVEVERKGHTPASARIPLLNETQRETLVMRRIDEESPFSNPYYSISIWIILTAAIIAFLYKCSRGKDATRDSSLTPDNI